MSDIVEGFTPGPWKVELWNGTALIVSPLSYRHLATVFVNGGSTLEAGTEWANARLIASAPDLAAEIPRLREANEALSRENEALKAALARSMTALDDWLNIFAEDMCEEERVREAKQRVYEHGSIHYISMVQQQNRAALRQKEGKP